MSYTNQCTVWQITGTNEFGQRSWRAGVFKSNDKLSTGQKISDSRGVTFSAKQKFWTALELVAGEAFVPKESDYVIRGNFLSTAVPTDANAEAIRMVDIFDNSMFGQADDYLLVT